MERTRVLIASSIDADALATLCRQHDVVTAIDAPKEVLSSAIRDREILIFRSGVNITAEVMANAPDLKLLIRGGSGLDNIDLDYARDHGIHLERIPGPGAQAVAEMAFGLMLALARNILVADRLLRQGRWTKYEMGGYLLRGKTLGIVGLGNIGTRVAKLGLAWGMQPIGCVEHPSSQRAADSQARGIRLASMDEVLASADFVSIHVPLKSSTRYLFDADTLATVKPGAYLLNFARGGVVDEQALYHELTEGNRLRGVALDVHEHEGEGKISPLAGLPNVVLTPHIGAMAIDAQREIGERILQLVDEYTVEKLESTIEKGKKHEPVLSYEPSREKTISFA
jgi:phosphoglycerate dehydrogenase-like enzyme